MVHCLRLFLLYIFFFFRLENNPIALWLVTPVAAGSAALPRCFFSLSVCFTFILFSSLRSLPIVIIIFYGQPLPLPQPDECNTGSTGRTERWSRRIFIYTYIYLFFFPRLRTTIAPLV